MRDDLAMAGHILLMMLFALHKAKEKYDGRQ
jgi:hypothetical protein